MFSIQFFFLHLKNHLNFDSLNSSSKSSSSNKPDVTSSDFAFSQNCIEMFLCSFQNVKKQLIYNINTTKTT
jgi:hypothetical protein